MAVFRPGLFQGGFASMSLRALFIAVRASPRSYRSFSTRRSISCACAVIARRAATRCASMRATREVVLTMPPRGSVREAKEFAQKHGGWIAARLKRLPEAAPFAHGIVVPLRGEPHRIVHRRGVRGTVWTETDGERPAAALRRGRAAACRSPHQRFPQARGAARSRRREPRLCGASSASRSSASAVRDQSSRWGSCSNTGVLSFSWRLILAPPFVLDYLAAHEVAHLVEINHSPRFWRLVQAPLSAARARQGVARVHGTDCIATGCPHRRSAKDI